MLRILGIDPGSIITGYGVIDASSQQVHAIDFGCVRAGKGPFPERLKLIFQQLTEVIERYSPACLAIENVFVSRNADSALKLGQARGAAICAAVSRDLPVAEYSPREIKQAVVGKGSADKVQVQHMVKILLNLDAIPQVDASDALATSICHWHHYQTHTRLAAAIRQNR